LHFIVESYKLHHPNYEFDWTSMIKTLYRAWVPVCTVETLVNMHRNSFAYQQYDMQAAVMELAVSNVRNDDYPRRFGTSLPASLDVFSFLIHTSVSGRLDSLGVERWRNEVNEDLMCVPVSPKEREEYATKLYAKLALFELAKESSAILELALWKAKIEESCYRPSHKNARANDEQISRKEQYRVNCGADVVVRNVLRYLVP